MSVPNSNRAFIDRLMQFSRTGALMQIWMLECVRRFGQQCKDTPIETFREQFGEDHIVSPEAWKRTGEEALTQLEDYLDKVGEAWKTQPPRVEANEEMDPETFRGIITPGNRATFHITGVSLNVFLECTVNDVHQWAAGHVHKGAEFLKVTDVRPFAVEPEGLTVEVVVDTTRWDRNVDSEA